MKQLVELDNQQYQLNLGEYHFSPLMEATTALSMEYIEHINEADSENEFQPLIFCFPEKKNASLWLSTLTLLNHFNEESTETLFERGALRKGQKVKIFDAIGEIERITSKKVILKFSDQGGIPINKKLQSQLRLVPSTRRLNKKSFFINNYKKLKTKRNAISKIMEPEDSSVNINPDILKSEILLISGRGNTDKLKKMFDDTEIYEESLNHIFGVNKNLIISPDLEPYKGYFDNNKIEKTTDFITWFRRLGDEFKGDEEVLRYEEAVSLLIDDENISEEFDLVYSNLIEDYEDSIPKLKHVHKKYPGKSKKLSENLKTVILNDIKQLGTYKNTIVGFLKKRIPVIVISNRSFTQKSEIDFFNQLFKKNPEYYRVNWTRSKIKRLKNRYSSFSFILDKDLWELSTRFCNQRIKISVTEENELDSMISKSQKLIQSLEGYEQLQKSYFKNMHPALYGLKNSYNANEKINFLIMRFKEDFDYFKDYGLPKEAKNFFENLISITEKFDSNNKSYSQEDNVFSSYLVNNDEVKLFVPVEKNKINLPSSAMDHIVFTGYPYREYGMNYLMDSISVYFIPKITIYCWPHEASLTYSYILRRLTSGYFVENLSYSNLIATEYLMTKSDQIDEEVSSFFKEAYKIPLDYEREKNLEETHSLKYIGFISSSSTNQSNYNVKCDILNFDNDCFMFLPKGGKVLAEVEDHFGRVNIRSVKVRDLTVGYKVFKYKRDRKAFRNISKGNVKMRRYFDMLETWKKELLKLYEMCNNDVGYLSDYLLTAKQTHGIKKGNPSRQNLMRWLFDNEVLSPDDVNLEIIYSAANVEPLKEKLRQMHEAYTAILSYTIQLSSKIKERIKQRPVNHYDDNDFIIHLNGSRIKVESRTLISVEENDLEIEYHNTRKILC